MAAASQFEECVIIIALPIPVLPVGGGGEEETGGARRARGGKGKGMRREGREEQLEGAQYQKQLINLLYQQAGKEYLAMLSCKRARSSPHPLPDSSGLCCRLSRAATD